PQPDLHPGQELLEAERLGHVVVGATFQPGHCLFHPTSGGEDDHRHPLAPTADLGEHLSAVHPRQPEVEDHQVEVAVPGGVGGGAPVLDCEGAEAGDLQALLDEGRDPGLVFGDQYAAQGVSLLGMMMVNRLPVPGSELTSTEPPWPRAIAATIGRPRPAPVVVRRPTSPRAKRSKMAPCSVSGIPGPVSLTWNRMMSSVTSVSIVTSDSGGVCS